VGSRYHQPRFSGFQVRLESQLRRVEAGDEDHQSLDLIEEIADWSD